MALARNPDLLAGRQQVETLAQDTLAALARPNPILTVEALHNLTNPEGPKAAARISQEFRPGYRSRSSGLAQARMEAGRQGQRAREWELIASIRGDFLSWTILNRKAALQQEVAGRWDGLSRLAQAKLAEGRLSEVDEAQTRLNLAQAKQREAELRSEMAALGKHLGYLVGVSPLPDTLTAVLPDTLPVLPPRDSLETWAARANPEIRLSEAEVFRAETQIALEENLGRPSFSLTAGYDRETDGANLIGGGVELPLPLFNRNQAGIAKARGEMREAEWKRRAAKAKVESDIGIAITSLESLALRIRAYQKDIRLLRRKQLDLAEKGFREGLLGVFELSRVQEEYLGQESEALDLLDVYYRTWNRLAQSVGGKIW
jgi:cobalt-zinc-cadmium efflux system outer membrane protein